MRRYTVQVIVYITNYLRWTLTRYPTERAMTPITRDNVWSANIVIAHYQDMAVHGYQFFRRLKLETTTNFTDEI